MRQLWHRAAELFLPSQERVIDIDEACAYRDRALDAPRSIARIDIPASPVERLGSHTVDADAETYSIESAGACLVLRTAKKGGSNALASMFYADEHVLQFGRISEREVDMAERLVTAPCHKVEAIALVQSRQPEN